MAKEKFGKYILFEKIASGGMAEVHLARSVGGIGLGKFLAIKKILPQYSDSQEFIKMFISEAKIAINLNHSNIVSIFDFGIENNQLFLAMEYVEGHNLRQILTRLAKNREEMPMQYAIYIVKEIAAGLDHAHRCLDDSTGRPLNIIHRDVSPQNIMCSFGGEVKIIDFGIAKAETQIEMTRTGMLKGKLGYMSPEQVEGLTLDNRTDIFSLGVIFWELLAHTRLFSGKNEVDTLQRIRDYKVPNLRKVNPAIPIELDNICGKALARERGERYQTCADLHRDLNRFLNIQYPDVSKREFSKYISGLFAPEIEMNSKKLIDYANSGEFLAEQKNAAAVLTNSKIVSAATKGSISVGKEPSVASGDEATRKHNVRNKWSVKQVVNSPITYFVLLIMLGIGGLLSQRSGNEAQVELPNRVSVPTPIAATPAVQQTPEIVVQEPPRGDIVAEQPAGEGAKNGPIQFILLASPAKGDTIWYYADSNIEFAWSPVAGADQYVFELSRDIAGDKKVMRMNVVEDKLAVPLANVGQYYWRIQAFNQQQEIGSSGWETFVVKEALPPEITKPSSNFQLRARDVGKGVLEPVPEITLEWRPLMRAEQFEIEVSTDRKFRKSLYAETLVANTLVLNHLNEGQYYWRVRSLNAAGQATRWSESSSFKILVEHKVERKVERKAEAPAIVSGPEKFITPQQKPMLKWRKTSSASRYLIEIAEDKDFSNTVVTLSASQPYYSWQNYRYGTFYWRVSAIGQDGQQARSDDVGKFKVQAEPPHLIESKKVRMPSSQSKKPAATTLKWSSIHGAKSYEVEIADNKKFANAQKNETAGESYKTSISKPGDYYWRVRGLSSEHAPISEFSDPSTLTVENFELPKEEAIEIVSPIDNTEFTTYDVNAVPFILLEWTRLKTAKYYLMQFSSSPSFSSPIELSAKNFRFFLNVKEKKIPKGKVYWRVRARTQNGFTEWTTPRNFVNVYAR